MASTFNRPTSPVIQMATILPDGKRVTRSLHTRSAKQSDEISAATQTLIDTLAVPEKARQTVLRVLVEDIFIAAKVPNPWEPKARREDAEKTLLDFATDYVERKRPRISAASCQFMESTIKSFADHGRGVPIALSAVTGTDCQAWYDVLLRQVVTATANNRFACLSAMFNQAVKIGVLRANPCAGVQTQEADESTREPLSDEDISRLCRYLESKGDKGQSWITAVTLARYAGLRLQDAANLKREHVVTAGDGLALFFVARKTGREVTVPCVPELAERLGIIDLDRPDSHTCLCPELCEREASSLSTEFVTLLEAAGIDTGKAEVNGRAKRSKGFHSLRHGFISDLARRGIPEDLRQLMAGHSSVRTHRGYVHTTAVDMAKRLAAFTSQP